MKVNKKTIKYHSSISFNSYIQGSIDDDVYLFDRNSKKQYRINPKTETIVEVGNEQTGIKYYNLGKWENRITINKRTLEKSKKCEVYGDIIVPDIKPDIVNIINTNANTYIYKTEISDGKVRVDGNIDAFVIYLADNGETRSISITLNFSEFIEDSSIIKNGSL